MTEAEKERAAVVAWLQDLAGDCPSWVHRFMAGAADAIERGEHLTDKGGE